MTNRHPTAIFAPFVPASSHPGHVTTGIWQPTSELDALQRILAGRYQIERELGRGAMGIVLLAREIALDRHVAIKLLPPALASQAEFRDRFLRESRTVAGMFHPHIVPIYAVEEHESIVFYVMGFVDGETLTARIERVGALPPSEVSRILQESAWALAHAHSRGIVHRDVKPDNILLERGTGRVLLTDFGIARINDSTMTAIGTSLGTPQFMSPEQAAGDATDARSDLYSLGLVGYYALAGAPPFTAPTMQAVMAMQVTKPAPPVSAIRAGIPPRLALAIDTALKKDPAARWPNAEALVGALRGEEGEAVEIAPQVRNFQRVAELFIMQTIGLVSVLPLIFASKPQRAAFPVVGVLLALVLSLLQVVTRARRVLRDGFTHDDVRRAFAVELRRREEEVRAITNEQVDPKREKRTSLTMSAMIIGGSMLVGGAIGMVQKNTSPLIAGLAGALFLVGGGLVVRGFVMRTKLSGAIEMRSARQSVRIWQGWFGRMVFALADAAWWRLSSRGRS
jgi:hypothetical protein